MIVAHHDRDARAGGLAFGEVQALANAFEVGVGDVAGDFDFVGFLDAERRVRHLVRELAVVGQNDQAARFDVEAPDGVDAALFGIGDHVPNTAAQLLFVVGAHDAGRLVEQVVAQQIATRAQDHAVPFDALGFRVDLDAELGHDLAVDHDFTIGNQLVGAAAGSDAVVGEQFVEAHEARGFILRSVVGRCHQSKKVVDSRRLHAGIAPGKSQAGCVHHNQTQFTCG